MMAGQSRAQEITEENLEQWIEASDQGNLEATYKVGCYYYDTAIEVVKTALRYEHGIVMIGDWDKLREIDMELSLYLSTEHLKAFIYWRDAADKGYAEAQYRMGLHAADERKISDANSAANWFRMAAEQGHREAQYRLAGCYYDGKGVTPDYAEAARWYRKAFEQGHALSLYRIGLCYYKAQNYTEAAKWYSKAAERGNIEAQYRLGLCYYGDRNYAEAVKWWRKASEQGHAEAQYHLGLCYYDGRGVAQDYSTAVRWWSKTRSVEARYRLGLCYYHGHGVTQDDYAAMKMWRSAATQGYGEAQYQLGMWYKNRRRYAEAASWWRMAAEQGHEEAKAELTTMYMKGETSTPPSTPPSTPTSTPPSTPPSTPTSIPTGTNADAAKDASAAEDKEVQPKPITSASVMPTGTIYGHEYVDLGLSVKWATCNVGALSPDDYGDYFAWGRTMPSPSCISVDLNLKYNKSKHCIAGKASHDVACAKWGGSWCMPTKEQFQELVEKCRWTWASLNGKTGYFITGPNGNSLFLPLAGYEQHCNDGERGYYWSATPENDGKSYAYYLNLEDHRYKVSMEYRLFGYSIRPVTE